MVEGIEEDQAIVVPGGLVRIGVQGRKHGAVLHIVAVHGHVVPGGEHVALLPGIDAAPGAVFTAVVPVEVVVCLAHRALHHRVVQLRALNAQPAHKIVVGVLFIVALVVPGQGVGLLRLQVVGVRNEFRGLPGLGGLRSGRGRNQGVLTELRVLVLRLLTLPEIGPQIYRTANQRHRQDHYNGYVNTFFHRASS